MHDAMQDDVTHILYMATMIALLLDGSDRQRHHIIEYAILLGFLGLAQVACVKCSLVRWMWRTVMHRWGAAKEGWPRNPPLSRVFLLLHVTTAPEDFEHKHSTFNAPTLGDIGSRVGDAQFWGVFGNPVLGRNPPRNPPC